MGRRGGMRGRSGLVFIAVLAVAMIILYWSWRSVLAPETKIEVKDVYSMRRQNVHASNDRPTWNNIIQEEQQIPRDPDYNLDNAIHHEKQESERKSDSAADFQGYEMSNNVPRQGSKLEQLPTPSASVEASVPEGKKYYRKPNLLILDTVESMERFVHLDLKGAAPNMSYLRKFLPMLSTLGATGLLMEYEDMFPYTGVLKSLRAGNAYTPEEIEEILGLAKKYSLKVMPLIQTFGHMEFVLKSDFSNLRESAYTPQVIDITQDASYDVISEMVKQVLDAHPDATHVHIGCDEVYELGRGTSATVMQTEQLTVQQMFLRHIKKVANIVANLKDRDITPVMWDDELRAMPAEDIENSELPNLVEIMVWDYTLNVLDRINNTVWEKYSKIFKSLWIASSFKGATGARQFFTDPLHHIQNHFSWLQVIAKYDQQLDFKGVALTGWQRYDHFATLCELLPVAIPSLAVCLATMKNAGFTEQIHRDTSSLISCDQFIEMSFPEIDRKTKKAILTQDCRFPGHEVYHAMQEFYGHTQLYISHRVEGWLSDYQVAHGFSNPGQLRVLSKAVQKQSTRYAMVTIPLKMNLAKIYSDDTVEEWIEENIEERLRRNKEIQTKITALLEPNIWPIRPLASLKSSSNMSSGAVSQSKRNLDTPNNENLLLQGTGRLNNVQTNMNVLPKQTSSPQNFPGINAQGNQAVQPVRKLNPNSEPINQNLPVPRRYSTVNEVAGHEKFENIRDKSRNHEFVPGQENPQIQMPDNGHNRDQGLRNNILGSPSKGQDIDKKEGVLQEQGHGSDMAGGLANDKNHVAEIEDSDLNKQMNQPDSYKDLKLPGLPPLLPDLPVNPEVEEDDKMRRAKYLTEERTSEKQQKTLSDNYVQRFDQVSRKPGGDIADVRLKVSPTRNPSVVGDSSYDVQSQNQRRWNLDPRVNPKPGMDPWSERKQDKLRYMPLPGEPPKEDHRFWRQQ